MSSPWSRLARPRAPLLLAAVLTLLSFVQSPGKITFDTKLDLPVDPGAFLGRALHLWAPQGGYGQLQDQAFGYLFPMGPFFLVGQLLHVPPWITQRLWEAIILVLAAEGMRRLSRALLPVTPEVALLGGAAYALAPRVLSVLGPISAEALPTALLPWALLPLVLYSSRDPRRAVLLSSCAVLAMGGANATLTVAVLPALLLWTLTRRVGRLRLLLWQGVGTLLAVGWWLAPLLLLGKYSPPFLNWIESAGDTTRPVDLLAALRGVDHWVAYVAVGGDPVWPVGHALIVNGALVLLTGLVAGLGLTGLARRDLPERGFLGATALLGLLALVIGHTGVLASPLGPHVQDLLDGALAPLRNIHKFDALLRLPVLLGMTHALSRLPGRKRAKPRLAPALATLGIAVLAAPLLLSGFRPGPGFDDVPSWWRSAATYIDQHGHGRTLVLPAAGYERYTWGRTIDVPLQSLAERPWTLRAQTPFGGAGSARLLDSVEGVLGTGRGSTSLADLLARSGIGQVLVRNDLDLRYADALAPEVVHAALAASPGLTRVAGYGPMVTSTAAAEHIGGTAAYASVEVFDVQRPVSQVHWYDGARTAQVSGGPEALLASLEAGAVTSSVGTVLTGDSDATAPAAIITDTLRKRERAFAAVHRALGPTLAAAEGFDDGRLVHDLLPFDATGHQTVATYDGIDGVRASSSASDARAPGGATPDQLPWAAIDGNPFTIWRSAAAHGAIGQWWEVRFAAPRDLNGLTATFLSDPLLGPAVTSVTVTGDHGSVTQPAGGGSLRTPPGLSRTLRLTVAGLAGPGAGNVALSEVALPGLTPTRTLTTPDDLTSGAAPSVVLGLDPEGVPACTLADGVTSCDQPDSGLTADPDQLDRTFTLRGAADLTLSGTVLPLPGPSLFPLLDPLRPGVRATASSTLGQSPLVRPGAALDGDPTTSWVPSPSDPAPTLHLTWPSKHTLTGMVLKADLGTELSRPLSVLVTAPTGTRQVDLGPDGSASFLALSTDRVDVTFPFVSQVASHEREARVLGRAPIAISELSFPSAKDEPQVLDPAGPTGAPCGFGPQIMIDGSTVPTQVVGTVADLLTSAPLQVIPCSQEALHLGAGTHHVQVVGTARYTARTLVLRPPTTPSNGSRAVAVRSWGTVHRVVDVGAGPAGLIAVPENANAGWVATVDGHVLTARTIDGWQQGWVLPAGDAGVVHLDFTPDRPYQLALVVGGAGTVVLLLLALWAVLRRRALSPRVPAGRRTWLPVKVIGAVVVALALAGLPGLGALVGAVVLVRFVRGGAWAPLLGLLVAAVVCAAVGATPSPGAERAEQLLVLGAVLTVLATFVVAD